MDYCKEKQNAQCSAHQISITFDYSHAMLTVPRSVGKSRCVYEEPKRAEAWHGYEFHSLSIFYYSQAHTRTHTACHSVTTQP